MQVRILIDPKVGGGFRATAGEPFCMSAEAESEKEAAKRLEIMVRSRLTGTRVAVLELGNGSPPSTDAPLRFVPVPGEDGFFQTLRQAIEENRQSEDEPHG